MVMVPEKFTILSGSPLRLNVQVVALMVDVPALMVPVEQTKVILVKVSVCEPRLKVPVTVNVLVWKADALVMVKVPVMVIFNPTVPLPDHVPEPC